MAKELATMHKMKIKVLLLLVLVLLLLLQLLLLPLHCSCSHSWWVINCIILSKEQHCLENASQFSPSPVVLVRIPCSCHYQQTMTQSHPNANLTTYIPYYLCRLKDQWSSLWTLLLLRPEYRCELPNNRLTTLLATHTTHIPLLMLTLNLWRVED